MEPGGLVCSDLNGLLTRPSGACMFQEGLCRISQNPVANDLMVVQHPPVWSKMTSTVHRLSGMAFCSAELQRRKEQWVDKIQAFRQKRRSLAWVWVVISIFDPKEADQTEPGMWFIWIEPVYWAVEGWLSVCGVLWLGHIIQKTKFQLWIPAAALPFFSKREQLHRILANSYRDERKGKEIGI